MRPFKTLLFLTVAFLLLALLSFFFPKQGIKIGPEILLKFPSPESVLSYNNSSQKDISGIIEQYRIEPLDTIIESDTLEFVTDSIEFTPDSITSKIVVDTLMDSIAFKPEKSILSPGSVKQKLEYPQNNKSILYSFFKSLHNLKTSDDLIRILHYGDSQIEGDRISSYIRKELQKEFGGSGIGLFPAVIIQGTSISVEQKLDGDWERFTMHDIRNGNIYHKRLGALMSFSRFAPVVQEGTSLYSGEITIKKASNTYLNTRKFKQCKVYYGFNEKPFIAELKYNDQTLDAELIPASQQLNIIEWEIDNSLNEFTIHFKGEDSPDIYAIALDDYKGIAVDNIPLRGSSGTDFTKTDLAFFRSMYQKLNVKLVMLQFGVNLVPHLVSDYSYYQKQLEKQLKTIKSLRPEICIIVIGVSDMSRNEGGNYVSYPNIAKIREAQRTAAFNADCAYWDSYEAMGGENSMPAWVNANPQLARTDYTHFTWKGSTVIAKMFYDALMNDYTDFLKSSTEQIQLSSNENN
jgi:lysophospholipase L1-like esterase